MPQSKGLPLNSMMRMSNWSDSSDHSWSHIRMKSIGEINFKPILRLCMSKFPPQLVESKASALHDDLQNKVTDPLWNPFIVHHVQGVPQLYHIFTVIGFAQYSLNYVTILYNV
ncbi:hypothetical protein LINPERPRIM_LOCUS4985 [Linum perenne]